MHEGKEICKLRALRGKATTILSYFEGRRNSIFPESHVAGLPAACVHVLLMWDSRQGHH